MTKKDRSDTLKEFVEKITHGAIDIRDTLRTMERSERELKKEQIIVLIGVMIGGQHIQLPNFISSDEMTDLYQLVWMYYKILIVEQDLRRRDDCFRRQLEDVVESTFKSDAAAAAKILS